MWMRRIANKVVDIRIKRFKTLFRSAKKNTLLTPTTRCKLVNQSTLNDEQLAVNARGLTWIRSDLTRTRK